MSTIHLNRHATVLSLSYDSNLLARREAALLAAGWEVTSVSSPGQARFEIEMGRCGIFVTCRQISDLINQDLMQLFRRHCPEGWVVFVTGKETALTAANEPYPDVRVDPADDPSGIVEALREYREQDRPAKR